MFSNLSLLRVFVLVIVLVLAFAPFANACPSNCQACPTAFDACCTLFCVSDPPCYTTCMNGNWGA